MRIVALLGLFAGLLTVLGACATPPGEVTTEPDFTGRITQLEQVSGEGTVGRVLVEATLGREGTEYVDKYMVTIKDETLILQRVGGDRRSATFEALIIGQQLQVWFVGPIAESYPAQVAARQIVILG